MVLNMVKEMVIAQSVSQIGEGNCFLSLFFPFSFFFLSTSTHTQLRFLFGESTVVLLLFFFLVSNQSVQSVNSLIFSANHFPSVKKEEEEEKKKANIRKVSIFICF